MNLGQQQPQLKGRLLRIMQPSRQGDSSDEPQPREYLWVCAEPRWEDPTVQRGRLMRRLIDIEGVSVREDNKKELVMLGGPGHGYVEKRLSELELGKSGKGYACLVTNRPWPLDHATRDRQWQRTYFCCRHAVVPAKSSGASPAETWPTFGSSSSKSGAIVALREGDVPIWQCNVYPIKARAFLEADDKQRAQYGRTQGSSTRYTHADLFCGAGGAAAGARLAGFHTVWALDKWPTACEVFKAAFPESSVLCQDADDPASLARVDVLHASPPCQPFSSANTREDLGKDSADHILSFMALKAAIDKAKPRVFTLEQVPGIRGTKGQNFLSWLIGELVEEGWSVRWQEVDCADHGVPQSRRRIILMASCPGQMLPHALKPRAESRTRIRDALQPSATQLRSQRAFWNSQASTIMATGPPPMHLAFGRAFTWEELARLQTFPDELVSALASQSTGRPRLKLIGNAVPSQFAKDLFESVRRTLQQTDELLID
ncbi:hypothetical protein PYCC9005_001705 [Savitreella phatthalungensis]